MTTQTIYHMALVGHIVGLTLMAGTTMADYIAFKQFWKQMATDRLKGLATREATSKFPMLIGIGILLLIISGITMMAITHGAFGEQIWFRIKFGLVLIIIINGLAVGRRQGVKLNKILSEEMPDQNRAAILPKMQRNIRLFHTVQLTLFISIFVLSVFKFN